MEKLSRQSISLGAKLFHDLKEVDYCVLNVLHNAVYNELKKRDISIGQSTGNCRSGNYKGELK